MPPSLARFRCNLNSFFVQGTLAPQPSSTCSVRATMFSMSSAASCTEREAAFSSLRAEFTTADGDMTAPLAEPPPRSLQGRVLRLIWSLFQRQHRLPRRLRSRLHGSSVDDCVERFGGRSVVSLHIPPRQAHTSRKMSFACRSTIAWRTPSSVWSSSGIVRPRKDRVFDLFGFCGAASD